MDNEATVFVVDDDAAVLHSVASALASRGMNAECFESADAFRQNVDATRPGCLIVDLKMPGMSGIQLLQQLKLEQDFRPAVVITGFAEIETVVQSMKLGAADFLQKPFVPAQLIEAAQQALEKDRRLRESRQAGEGARSKLATLPKEEIAVMSRLARGLTNQQIAN